MNAKQAKALAMLVSGEYSMKQIAEKLKIAEKTLYNWRQEGWFEEELNKRLHIKVGTLAAKALRVQEEMLSSKSDTVKHLAAKDILDRGGYAADSKVHIDSERMNFSISVDYGDTDAED